MGDLRTFLAKEMKGEAERAMRLRLQKEQAEFVETPAIVPVSSSSSAAAIPTSVTSHTATSSTSTIVTTTLVKGTLLGTITTCNTPSGITTTSFPSVVFSSPRQQSQDDASQRHCSNVNTTFTSPTALPATCPHRADYTLADSTTPVTPAYWPASNPTIEIRRTHRHGRLNRKNVLCNR